MIFVSRNIDLYQSPFPFSFTNLQNKTSYTLKNQPNKTTTEELAIRLSAIFDNAIDGIIIIDAKGIIEQLNPAAAKLFGYQAEEIIGLNIRILMPEPHHSQHGGYIHRYHSTGEAKIIGIGREVEGLRKDGTTFPFNLSISEVKLHDSILFTGVIHDLSAQKEIENRIREMNKMLEKRVASRTEELSDTVNKLLELNTALEFEVIERKKAEQALQKSEVELRASLDKEKELNELKSRFVSMASHEFRTPLSTINSSAALIGRYTEQEQQDKREKHVNRIKSAVKNLTGILNDFLSLSKLEEGKVNYQPEQLVWKDFYEEVKEELELLLKKNQELIFTSQIQQHEVFLDSRLMKNILFNLISNAIKYSSEGKRVFCSSIQEGPLLTITVKDEGMGIPEEDQQYLFTRFFRATNVSNIKGTGLGLTIVKRYLNLMDGEISFSSIPNEGTTFTIKLPIESKEPDNL